MKKIDYIVLDCSVTMTWILPGENTEKTDAILASLKDKQVKVPTIWPLEVANVLCFAEQQKKLSALDVSEFKEFLSALPINIDNHTSLRAMGSIYILAKTEQLTIYDAAYLEIAIRESLPLATLDKALKKAAQRNNVSLL